MRFLRIRREDLPRWHAQLEALERRSVYPLGDDAFRISHGDSYFAFFERLGEIAYYGLEHEGELVAVGCGVLRPKSARGDRRRWYIADIKVRPDQRGRHLPVKLVRRAFVQNWLRCGRGYAVLMNGKDGRLPPALRSWTRVMPLFLLHTFTLDIFAADDEGARRALPLLPAPAHFVSLRGIKDLLLERTGTPLPLLHVRRGPPEDDVVFEEPQRDHTHMWCAPREGELGARLRTAGFTPTASATVAHHRMGGFDWSWLDTSEI